MPVTDPRDASVDVTWSAIGDLTSFRQRSVSHSSMDGQKCMFAFSARGERRDAVATGTVDGISLGDSTFAQISQGRFSFSDRCR